MLCLVYIFFYLDVGFAGRRGSYLAMGADLRCPGSWELSLNHLIGLQAQQHHKSAPVPSKKKTELFPIQFNR